METGNKGCHSPETRRCHTVSPCSIHTFTVEDLICVNVPLLLLEASIVTYDPDLPCSATATYDDLLLSNEYFDEPIPLAEMVEFLVDAWIQVCLPGKDLSCASSLAVAAIFGLCCRMDSMIDVTHFNAVEVQQETAAYCSDGVMLLSALREGRGSKGGLSKEAW